MGRVSAIPTRKTRAKYGGARASVEERLLAAMERLLQGGNKFSALTVEQLTSEAGMVRQSFYAHFKDKGDLISRLVAVVGDDIVSAAGAWLAYAEQPQRRDVENAVAGVAAAIRKHRTLITAFNDMARHDDAVEAQYQAMMDSICQRCRHSVAAARRAGLARDGANDYVADGISWFVMLFLSRIGKVGDEAEYQQLTAAVSHICLASIFRDGA